MKNEILGDWATEAHNLSAGSDGLEEDEVLTPVREDARMVASRALSFSLSLSLSPSLSRSLSLSLSLTHTHTHTHAHSHSPSRAVSRRRR